MRARSIDLSEVEIRHVFLKAKEGDVLTFPPWCLPRRVSDVEELKRRYGQAEELARDLKERET